ncbi:glycerophosphodiester phosphodiesterase domain-containing protein 5 [Strongylocentrotus purpuratus]|uniref:GP-PDE domain-containing protein n=1 Tax=Strongylocentrotus purpuratus TaxID=7668 RepID=A0A7M7RF89_STRPU|nr:glycerophosphodiester phosphodiesterase domain-containing protein 5 [Strongylocentrotus purpuratus]XP_011664406.1 glycerophosphodiester phosphodiesterase domain-containing protein 5 [Strongylocentrotus purpuratus]XP_797443.3 glycerophosphodiester phosphodiesterase domain-containing protein 5 [Strongylocentrotus purpuratus]|eukprot:XP_011664405.1 PREDICTED: glycerophosphodiester phosphodiesterase domain-containing protein 5 [Strongylocentrotus purpuratus]
MVSHVRLEKEQKYRQQVCLSCVTGLYGCRWKRYRRSTEPTNLYEKIWLGVVVTSFIFMLIWLYFWLIAQNDSDDLNWFIWEDLSVWFDWFTLLFAWCIIALLYLSVLLLLAISHCFIGQQLYLHWFHKALQVLILLGCIITAAMMSKLWGSEFHLLAISLQVTSPILQIVLVVVLTTLTWPFAGLWYRTDNSVVKALLLISYSAIMVFFYLIPLFMDVPCVAEKIELPPKPKMFGHRGAEEIAPENTMISFETAVNNSIYGLESDIRISWDGVPFLMHDDTLERTTNVAAVFPNRTEARAETFTWDELKQLDAGSWFLQKDPFHTGMSIPRSTREQFDDQRILSLTDLMEIAKKYNKTVIFDMFGPPHNHPYGNISEIVVDTILQSGIRQNQIFWLGGNKYVRQKAPGFVQTVEGRGDISDLLEENITQVNAEYSEVADTEIHEYSQANISTNVYIINEVWLYSLYWCVGATSITTSACHILKNVETPIWHMTKTTYLIAWVLVDAVSVICVGLIFLLQRVRHPNHITNPEAISLNSPRQKTFPHHHHRKSDREVLYQSNEDTSAVTPTADIDGTIGNMAIVMEDPVANIAPQDHDEVQMQFD